VSSGVPQGKEKKSRFEEAGTSLYPELAKQHLSLYSLPLETLRMNFFFWDDFDSL